jgi:hypothetical protein
MKSNNRSLSYLNGRNTRSLIKALLLGLFALNRQVKAQEVLALPPQAPDPTPSAIQQANPMDLFAAKETQAESQPFQWKALTLRPYPYYQFLYGEGLQYAPGQSANTIIQEVSLGALLEMGSHWTLNYTPIWTIYSNNHFQSDFGQAISLAGGTVYNDWVLGFSQGYTDLSSPSAVTATQVRQETFATAVDASYTMNSKMSLDLAVNQNLVSADQFSSYNEWSTLDWLNYQFWPQLDAAIGVGGGYDNEAASPDMSFEQIQGRVNWRATEKISFQLHGGAEFRQILSGGTSDLINPVFDGTIQYQPFEHTKIFLTGQEVVSASYLSQAQVTETTGVSAGLNQRLLGKLFLDLSGSYQAVKYVASASAPASSRDDKYYSFNARLSRTFLKRGTIAVIYQYSKDNSSLAGYSFNSNQVGFQIGFRY